MIITLALVGCYLAFTVPVDVFPSTNFPRILIGVDNGVMPIDQMMVTITRPLEEAVNSVPGLLNVRSITSRGSAEIDLFFDWNVDMFQTLQYVNAALSRAQSELPATAKIRADRLTFASFPIMGYSFTADNLDQTKLWEMATYEIKPRLNRLDGVSTVVIQGGQEPEFHIIPDPAKLLVAGVTVTDILESVRRTNLIDSPGLLEENHQLILGLISGQVHSPEEIESAFRDARTRGNEGLMIKDPNSVYSPGRRGLAWLKLKKAYATLDCVVVGAEYGHGKRKNVLSDYTFAVRDDETGELKTIGKAYSGLTDVEIAQLTNHFLSRVIRQHGRYHEVAPDTVLEIAFDRLQQSTRHSSGMAMRFPRILRIRTDKTPEQIDTIGSARRLLKNSSASAP